MKIPGLPIMALIVLTEPDPEEALISLMKRCAYVVIPVSIFFIKYYPQLGPTYDQWTGSQMVTGITKHKNGLGSACMILGFFFFWHWLRTWRTERKHSKTQRASADRRILDRYLVASFARAHSATSLTCLCVGMLVIVFVGTRFINKNFIGTYMLAALVLIAAAELSFGLWAISPKLWVGALHCREEKSSGHGSCKCTPIRFLGLGSKASGYRRQAEAAGRNFLLHPKRGP